MKQQHIASSVMYIGLLGGIAGAQAPAPQFALVNEQVVTGARANGYVLLGDVDGDGLLDAVSSDLVTRTIKVMLLQPGGTWSAPVDTVFTAPFTNPEPPYALADLNEDGRVDIVVSLYTSNLPSPGAPNIGVRFGSPTGQFVNQLNLNNQPGQPFPATASTRGIALADVNHDGHVDILSKTSGTAASGYVQHISVMLGDGTGAFGPSILSGLSAYEFLVTGDIDGDGHLDAVTVNNTGSNSHASCEAYVNLGDGTGQFFFVGTQVFDCRLSTPSGNPRCFLEDVDGDGRADLILFGNPGSQTGAGGIYVRKSIGAGAFSQIFHQPSPNVVSTILVRDVNGDARPDILRFNRLQAGGTNTVLINDGAGGFTATAPFPTLGGGFEPRDATAGPLVGTALPDVVVMGVNDNPGAMRLYLFENTTPTVGGSSFCSGDGSGAACPCGNTGSAGHGCASSVVAGGAQILGSGAASLAADTFVLAGTGMPNSSALYFQGTNQLAGGLGTTFGDGLRCAGGSIVRLGTETNATGASQYPSAGDPSISVKGLVTVPGTRTYQVWYRNAAAFCTPSTFNLTNGWEIAWQP